MLENRNSSPVDSLCRGTSCNDKDKDKRKPEKAKKEEEV